MAKKNKATQEEVVEQPKEQSKVETKKVKKMVLVGKDKNGNPSYQAREVEE